MQDLTLAVMLRVVFGSTDPRLGAAIQDALALTRNAPRLVAMSLGAQGRFKNAVERFDHVLYDAIAHTDTGIVGELQAASQSEREVRDQLVTLLAAGHETTATALAWAFERLGQRPDVVDKLPDDAYRDAVVKEVLRVRPVLSIAPRKLAEPFEVAGRMLPAGVHVAACIYLAHRRADTWGDPHAFRPERWLADSAPPPSYAYIPWGGGTRRCLGAAFASMEMETVLDEAARLGRFASRPERVRRRAVTLSPARGGEIRWS